MKSKEELRNIFEQNPLGAMDGHIHTHLCDGKPEMTVSGIADRAKENGLKLIMLTPHFHKKVGDETAVLYEDSDEEILLRLREEIITYQKQSDGKLQILLSVEADILSESGETALQISKAGEDALDLVTPTVNYHPLLPLKAVEVTYGRCIEEMYTSGLYSRFAEAAGGVRRILESLYETEANAIRKSRYPAILGHFFAAHSYAVWPYSWFGAKEEHLEVMKQGAGKVLDACESKGAFVDLTGIHLRGMSCREKMIQDDFFFDFQSWFTDQCRKRGICMVPGSDSHSLESVGNVTYYSVFDK